VDQTAPLLPSEVESEISMAREWRIQRLGRAALVALIAGALAGLLGPGPLSWSDATTADGTLEVEYSRFARQGADIALRLRTSAAAAAGDEQVSVVLGRDLLDVLEVRQVSPEPEAQRSTSEGVTMDFAVAEGAALEVTVAVTVEAMGWHRGSIGLAGQPPLRLGQFFYP
jgi:hypothetical protein